MDEIIMQVTRTIACRPRLQILARLARHREVAPTVLADELRMTLPVVSAHLRRLAAAGLMQRRRSASWNYGVARSPYGPQAFSGRVAVWLFGLLKQPSDSLVRCGLEGTRKLAPAAAEAQLHDIIFEAATAFTHMRRLCLLRLLAQGKPAKVEQLARTLKMSPSALSRHAAKLVRRGYVTAESVGLGLSYHVAPISKTPIHAQMWGFVRQEWNKVLQT